MEEKFRFLEHTSDAKFQAFGATLEEAFANAALATASLMWEPEAVDKKTRVPIRVQGRDLEQLLVRFLEEIIFLVETRFFLTAAAEGLRIEKGEDGYFLEADFWGDASSDKYQPHGGVKAITYNEMSIVHNERYTVQVVVDI